MLDLFILHNKLRPGFRGLLELLLDPSDPDVRQLVAGHLANDKFSLFTGGVSVSRVSHRTSTFVLQFLEKEFDTADIRIPVETVIRPER